MKAIYGFLSFYIVNLINIGLIMMKNTTHVVYTHRVKLCLCEID